MTIIALAFCLAVAIGMEIWQSSHSLHAPIGQSAAAQQEYKANNETIEERHQATEEAIARYNKWLMFFTAILAAATVVLGSATIGLYFAGERQLKFIQAEFVTTHRPRLIVRHVLLAADVSPIDTVVLLGHDADAVGGLSVVNVGGSDAHIVHGKYRIYFGKNGVPPRSPLDERSHLLLSKGITIKRGESSVIEIWDKVDLGPPDSTGLRDIRQFGTEGWKVYVMGEIRYQDEGRADHFMGFCRERQSDGKFRPVDDPDYEYQD